MHISKKKPENKIKSNYDMTKEERFRELTHKTMFYDTEIIGCYVVTTQQNKYNEELKIEATIATGNGVDKITITKDNLDRYETMDRAMDNVDPHSFAAYTAFNMDVQALKAIVIEMVTTTGMMTKKQVQQMIGGQD